MDAKLFVRSFVELALNGRDLDLADRHFSPEWVGHVPGRRAGPRGPGAFKAIVQTWHMAFSDWHMTIDDLIVEGDKVVNRFTTTGTHDGPLFEWPATGRTFEVHGVVIHRIEEGLVRETWVSDDLPSMLAQLGLLNPAEKARTA